MGVYSCAFSPDETRIVSASRDKTLKVWDAQSGEEMTTLEGHEEAVTGCVFLPSGRILSSSFDNTIRVWDVDIGRPITTIRALSLGICACSRSGKHVLSATWEDQTLRVWETETGDEAMRICGHKGSLRTFAYSLDGRRIVSGASDGTVKVADSEAGREVCSFAAHRRDIYLCAISPDGKRVVSASDDRTVKLWNAESGEEIATLISDSNQVRGIVFSPDGSRVVSGEMRLTMWDAETGKELFTFSDYCGRAFAYSPDGSRIVTESSGRLCLWNAESGELISTIAKLGQFDSANACVYSPSGRRVACASNSGLRIWDVSIAEQNRNLEGSGEGLKLVSEIDSCVFSPEGGQTVTGSYEGILQVWDSETGHELRTQRAHKSAINCCCYSPDGSRLLTASGDRRIKLWDARSFAELAMLVRGPNDVNSCAYSPDGSRFVAGLDDGSLIVLDAKQVEALAVEDWQDRDYGTRHKLARLKGREVAVLTGHRDGTVAWEKERFGADGETSRKVGKENRINACAYAPDGLRILSCADDEMLKVWNSLTGLEIRTLNGHGDRVNDCAYSPDGRRIVSGSGLMTNGGLKVWDARVGQEIAELRGHSHWVLSCRFSPDGRWIVSGSRDESIRVWDALSWKEAGRFQVGRSVTAMALGLGGRRVAAADSGGTVHVLRLLGFELGALFVTAVYRFRTSYGEWDDDPTASCAGCGVEFAPSRVVTDAIGRITREWVLSSSDSPCEELFDEVWDEPSLMSTCPHCRQPLRFNPFIVDNRDR
jgi:WD40 repeat protein